MKWSRWNTVWASLAVCCGLSLPVQAQVDLSGTWAPRLHEDYGTVAVLAQTPNTNREFISISYQFARPLGR